jgi:phage-related protein
MTANEPEWTIEFYTDARGKSEPVEFINGLQKTDRAKVRHYLRLLRLDPITIDRRYAKPVTAHKPLWELRPQPYRLLYFAHTGRRLIILHAFRKKGRRLKAVDIDTAERRMEDFLQRERRR